MSERRDPLPALTSLRFVAAAGVVALHLCMFAPDPGAWTDTFWWGTAGVTFFFTLSGFILTYNYHDRFGTLSLRGLRDFYAARWARIFPVHLLGLVLILVLTGYGRMLVAGEPVSLRWKAAANATLLHAFIPDPTWHVSFNGPAWSLSVEWFFYLAFPFMAFAWAHASLRRRVILVALACGCWAAAWALRASGEPPARTIWFGYIFPPTRLFDFLAGCLLARALLRRPPPAVTAWRGRLRATAAEAAAAASVVAAVAVAPYRERADLYLLSWCGYFTPVFLAVIWVFARGRGYLSILLSRKLPIYLGEISYAVYMLHLPVLLAVSPLMPGLSMPAKCALAAGAILAAAAVCYRVYEMPLRDWFRRKLSSPRRAGPPAPPPVRPARVPVPRLTLN